MKQALLIIDVQPCFSPPQWQVAQIARLARTMHSVATVERHDEAVTPFWRQLGWKPAAADDPLVPADRVFVKHGDLPQRELVGHLRSAGIERVLVCGLQEDTCCLAAGFMLFGAGLHPTLLTWLTVGSSLDRSANLGASLRRRHFGAGNVLHGAEEL
ncbi:cysteine hydrolase family protein [Methylobacterium sp. ID0610]|uniref:cysteine hydrolase family protein n=1 Tax=Methylobacterium carpenticola TaxID=3344827 RepID=UPI00369CEAAE